MQPLEVRDVGFDDIAATLVRGPEQKPGWFELWLDPNKAQDLWNLLMKAGAERRSRGLDASLTPSVERSA